MVMPSHIWPAIADTVIRGKLPELCCQYLDGSRVMTHDNIFYIEYHGANFALYFHSNYDNFVIRENPIWPEEPDYPLSDDSLDKITFTMGKLGGLAEVRLIDFIEFEGTHGLTPWDPVF